MDDLDAVKRVAGVPDVALVLFKPLVTGIEVHDDEVAQGIICRSKGRASPLHAGNGQMERFSLGGMHRERNAWVIRGAVPEAPLPVRYYLPPEDITEGVLRLSSARTLCAYKWQATYWSTESEDDIAWSYPEPLREAAEVTDRIAFYNERVDLVVDGTRLERPVTPWSRR